MNPDWTMISENLAVDGLGNVYYEGDAGEFTPLIDIEKRGFEAAFDRDLRGRFELNNENEMISIRVFEGKLMWMKANVFGGGEGWQEVSPNIGTHGTLEELRDRLLVKEPEAYEIGWYQDSKGDLYQFDGKTWVGTIPKKNEIENLEYLGG